MNEDARILLGRQCAQAGLPAATRLTALAVWTYRGPAGAPVSPTIESLAKITGSTERSVRRHLRSLEDAGILHRAVRPGHLTLYVFPFLRRSSPRQPADGR